MNRIIDHYINSQKSVILGFFVSNPSSRQSTSTDLPYPLNQLRYLFSQADSYSCTQGCYQVLN